MRRSLLVAARLVVAAAAAGAPRGSISITVPCGDAFDERLKWLLSLSDAGGSPLLRVEEIGPADSPCYARVAGAGTSLWLSREQPALPLTLRVAAEPSAAPAPAGCEAVAVAADACEGHPRELPLPLRTPALRPRLSVSTQQSEGGFGVGRAGMLYRDLLPDRAGGAVIASHIRIPSGGPVPDYVHFHRVAFQLIFCLDGWVDVVYEGQARGSALWVAAATPPMPHASPQPPRPPARRARPSGCTPATL